jgi:acetoin utilization protein AcuB
MTMLNQVIIGDVMTVSPYSIDIKDKLVAAQQLMSDKAIRHLPVLEGKKAVSVLTDRDINLALAANKNVQAAEELMVEDVCALNLYQVDKAVELSDVVSYMAEKAIGSVLITDQGKLNGIFTATDACKYLAMCLNGEFSKE